MEQFDVVRIVTCIYSRAVEAPPGEEGRPDVALR
jgi:hypothetical protein